MASNVSTSITESSSLISKQSPTPKRKGGSASDNLISCCLISSLSTLTIAGETAGLYGLNTCDLGLNRCTILSSSSLGFGLLTAFILIYLCNVNSDKTTEYKKRNIKIVNGQE